MTLRSLNQQVSQAYLTSLAKRDLINDAQSSYGLLLLSYQ